MNVNIKQIISLISYGNQYLIKNQVPNLTQTVISNNSEKLTISFLEKNWGLNKVIATTPINWFEYLKQKGCLKLQLLHSHKEAKKYTDVSLTGGGKGWYIKANFSKGFEIWNNKWIHDTDPGRSYIKSTKVEYLKLKGEKISQECISLQKATRELHKCLIKIKNLAHDWQLNRWENVFTKTIKILESNSNQVINNEFNTYLKNLVILENYPPESIQLLVTANRLFIFTGWYSLNEFDWWGAQS